MDKVTNLFAGSKSKALAKGLEMANKYVQDPDKRNAIVGRLLIKHAEAKDSNIIVDATHKLGRQVMMMVLAYWYYESWQSGNPIPLEDFLAIAGGPLVYTVVKGKGSE
jgi:hypothetical protein